MPNIYDELPHCTWRCQTQYKCYSFDPEDKFRLDEEFHFIFLYFDFSKSKNYPKAMKVYRSIPEKYRIELQAHCVQIFYYSDYLKIRRKFNRLLRLVHGWKLTQLWINNQLCTETEFRHFIDIFDSRVRVYKRNHELPEIEEE